jgi:hypothetical protein
METEVQEKFEIKKNLGLIEDLICRLGSQDIDDYSKFRLLEAIKNIRNITKV